eukprot:s14_g16.t1
MAIRRIATNTTQAPIAQAAEKALADLLVDSQTAEEVEDWDDGYPSIPPGQTSTPSTLNPTEAANSDGRCQLPPTKKTRSQQTITRDAAAAAAARFLSSLGHGQLSEHRRAITYHMVEPHVAALLRWLGTLSADMALHLQLPPALASLRGILNSIDPDPTSQCSYMVRSDRGRGSPGKLGERGKPSPPCRCSRSECGEPRHAPVAEVSAQTRGKELVETLTALLGDLDWLPQSSLPAAQEAAMRLVRRI